MTPGAERPYWPPVPWAADNGCFNGLCEVAFRKMLRFCMKAPTPPLFVTVPDVVGDAHETEKLFYRWWHIVADHGLKLGFVIQDHLLTQRSSFTNWVHGWATCIPWAMIDCIFIGGSTEFKLGPVPRKVIKHARAYKPRRIWIHMGRVNSFKRLQYAYEIGCDSVDGTGFCIQRHKLRTYLDFAGSQGFLKGVLV